MNLELTEGENWRWKFELLGVGDCKVMGMDQISREYKKRGLGTGPCGFPTFRGLEERHKKKTLGR